MKDWLIAVLTICGVIALWALVQLYRYWFWTNVLG